MTNTDAAFILKRVTGVITDMDGVLWQGDEPLPGMRALFDFVRAHALPFALATNNSTKAPDDYVDKLARLGVAGVRPDQIVTSGIVAAGYLRIYYPPGSRVYVIGGEGLKALIVESGFELADDDVRAVVVGLDTALTYEKLKRATILLRRGADYIATNDDATIPSPDGLLPGAGSVLAALNAATSRTPDVLGKPNSPMFQAALRSTGTTAGTTLMIGDRINTDVVGAQALGMHTALVLSGVATREEVERLKQPPDLIFDSVQGLVDAWRAVYEMV